MADETTTSTPDVAAPRRRGRAASRPAGPPADAAAPELSEQPAPAALAESSDAPTAPAGEEPAAAPAKRRRSPRKSAAARAAESASVEADADPSPAAPTLVAPASDADASAEPDTVSEESAPAPRTRRRRAKTAAADIFSALPPDNADEPATAAPAAALPPVVTFQPPDLSAGAAAAEPADAEAGDDGADDEGVEQALDAANADGDAEASSADEEETAAEGAARRRRRGRRGRGRGRSATEAADRDEDGESPAEQAPERDDDESADDGAAESESTEGTARRRRRRRRRSGSGGADGEDEIVEDGVRTVTKVRSAADEVQSVKGSTRLEARRQRRRDGRETGRRRGTILTESEFLARRESVDRVMLVRQSPERTQIAVLEDGVLVEHYMTRSTAQAMAGNVYLGRVQNVLPSMEAAFVDIGRGRNAVLYAGEVNYDTAAFDGKPQRIEQALKSGQSVLVQVTKDPLGHKGARLTSQISLPGRFVVLVPGGERTGISRKLPDTERSRLKSILKKVAPEDAGLIVRTAAEGASEEDLTRDVARLVAQWEHIQKTSQTANAPALIAAEPDLVVRVIRDIFNEDVKSLVVAGDDEYFTVSTYVETVAPDLRERVTRWTGAGDLFAHHRVDEQLAKALDRKVWLPSGGYLIFDRTEAMVVVDVNTGKFTGQGGNLEETVTRNNLEAAEEIARQLRLRDLGGIIVIDFIDMVLEANRDLVLRRLLECLGRDRTNHQVAEVTSLGLVQMTRKRVGQGLLDAFSETCPDCGGRGVVTRIDPFQAPEVVRVTPASFAARPRPADDLPDTADDVAHDHEATDGTDGHLLAAQDVDAGASDDDLVALVTAVEVDAGATQSPSDQAAAGDLEGADLTVSDQDG